VAPAELAVAEPLRDAQGTGVVGRELDRAPAQVELVEEVAVDREGRVAPEPLAPARRVDDEPLDQETKRRLLGLGDRFASVPQLGPLLGDIRKELA
jgi:hypothetical protein